MSDATLGLAPPSRSLPQPFARLASSRSLLVFFSLVVALVASGPSLLGDPDTQWHIAVGRQIWTSGRVPDVDLFSHTFHGAPWIAKEWLSQVMLYAANAAGGWRGVVLLSAIAFGLAFGLLHEWLRRRLEARLALGMLLPALALAMPHVHARPHILVLPVVVAWMMGILHGAERGRPPHVAFALVMTAWANMHGSFPLGLAMAGLMAAEGVLQAPAVERVSRAVHWGLFLALAVAATMLSPYGWHAALVALRMEGNAETLRYIEEWRPLTFDATGCLALAMLAASLIALLSAWRSSLMRIIAILLLGSMMVRHERFVSLFGLLAPLLVARALARWPGFAARSREAPQPAWGAVVALAAACVAAVAIVSPRPSADVTPTDAYQSAVAAGVKGPVYNDYDFGGFLIEHGVQTFIDGRTDQLFLGDFLPSLTRASSAAGNDDFAALLAKYQVTWALVRTRSNDARHLSSLLGWKRIHTDAVASVFVKE